MKKLMTLAVLAVSISTSAFASDVVGRSVKDAGKHTGKAVAVTANTAKDTAKGAAKASVHVVKFLF